MGYVTPEQIARAKELDLLTYLQRFEPLELVRVGGNTWCTREHDSLKISNGKWHWFSRGIGGRSALDYLIKVKGFPFPRAVEELSGQAAEMPPVFHAQKPKPAEEFELPELNGSTDAVVKYLTGRGIHPDILDYCLSNKLLFETRKYHNAMFAGYDSTGEIRYAALRGTAGDFKGEVYGSDKRYSFSIAENPNADSVHLFESAIDLLSYGTLMKMRGRDWRQDNLLSLGGVCRNMREDTTPAALGQYLNDCPSTGTVFLHLDNDETGRIAAAEITRCLEGRCKVVNQPPSRGKDVNELLQIRLGQIREKELANR